MFLKVDKSNLTMGDLVITGLEGDEGGSGRVAFCQFLNASGGRKEGTVDMYWYDFGTKGQGTECEDWMYGWYDNETGESCNDLPLPAGEGVWMYSYNTKYSIQNAGEVAKAPVSVQLFTDGGAKMVVNPMPGTIKMGDLYITGLEGDEGGSGRVAFCQFLNASGGRNEGTVDMYWYDFGTKGQGTECEDWMYGWYDNETGESCNDLPLPAGEGVWMYSYNTKYFANVGSILAD